MKNIENLKDKDTQKFQALIQQYGKYWKWYLISACFFTLLGIAYIKYKSPVFSINANVLIKTDDSKSGGMSQATLMKSLGSVGGMMSSESIDDETQVMSSQSLYKQMIYNLGIYSTYKQAKFPFDKSLYSDSSPLILKMDRNYIDTMSIPVKFKITILENKKLKVFLKADKHKEEYTIKSLPYNLKTQFGEFHLDFNPKVNPKLPYKLNILVLGLDPAAELMRKIISVDAVSRRSNMIALSINDDNKKRGKDILNEIIKLYNIDALNDKNKTAVLTNDFLKTRTDSIYGDLRGIEGSIEKFKVQNKLTDAESEAGMALNQIAELKKKDIEFEIQKSMLSSIEGLIKGSNSKDQLVPQSLVLSDNVNTALGQYNDLILYKLRLLKTSSEDNPVVQALNDRISQMNKQVVSTLNHAKAEFAMAKSDWDAKQGEVEGRTSQIPEIERGYLDLKRQQEIKSEIYVFLLQRLEENQVALAATASKAKIIDKAYSLTKPVAPKKIIILLGSFAFGIILSLIIVYFIESLKKTIESKDELERLANAEVIGEIAKGNPNQRVVVENNSTNPMTELFRLLRGNLMFTLNEPGKKVILVTSTLPGEGKTYVSSNLAVSFSLTEKKTVLVGLDIRNPKITDTFTTKHNVGVTSYLSKYDCQLDEIIQPSTVSPFLDIITSGPIPPNPNELLLKNRLDELINSLRERYDFIILDSAPIGVVSDTYHLNRVSDVCLYVTFIGKTQKESIRLLNSVKENNKLKNVYVVANGIDLKKKNGGYGYGYSKH